MERPNRSTVCVCRTSPTQPRIRGSVGNRPCNIFLDSGASVSLVKMEYIRGIGHNDLLVEAPGTITHLSDVNGNEVKILGYYSLKIQIGDETLTVPLIAVDDILRFDADVLLGVDAMRTSGMTINFEGNIVTLNGKEIPLEYITISELVNNSISKITRNPRGKGLIRARIAYDQVIPPKAAQRIDIECYNAAGRTTVFWPNGESQDSVESGVIDVGDCGKAVLIFANSTNQEVNLRKDMVLGTCEVIDLVELDPGILADVQEMIGAVSTNQGDREKIIRELDEFVVCESPHRAELLEVLADNRSVIALPGEPVGKTHLIELALKLSEGAKPIALMPYKIPHAKEAAVDEEIDRLLEQGIIKPTTSPWAFPVVLVTKPDKSLRMCVDYRRLNEITESDSYPLPIIEDLISDLGNSTTFSQIDLIQAYHQVPLSEETGPMTAFRTRKGHYEYTVAPFGLKQMPAVFQRLMNLIFSTGKTKQFVSAYLDDLLVHSKHPEAHLDHLREIFEKLRRAGLRIKLKKMRVLPGKGQVLRL